MVCSGVRRFALAHQHSATTTPHAITQGRIWTMVAGGGASVIYADTVGDLGFADEARAIRVLGRGRLGFMGPSATWLC